MVMVSAIYPRYMSRLIASTKEALFSHWHQSVFL